MATFKKTRELLLLSYADNLISDEEFVLLYDENRSDNLDIPYDCYDKFDLDLLTEDECWGEFRIAKHDIPFLADVLDLPDVFKCPQRSVCDKIEGLCILLKRFAYPCRYQHLVPRFARPVPVLSMLANEVMDDIFDNHYQRIVQWNNTILNPNSLQDYSDAISAKGAPFDNCFGFLDGTVRPICCPGVNQAIVYNGHKRVHALKYQSLVLPNGLIAHLHGPVEERRHDSGILHNSGLLQDLQQNAYSLNGQPYCIYGDGAYPLRVHLQTPFRNVAMTPQMQAFNTSMSKVRISVEWVFGDITTYFKFVDFKKNLKLALSSIGKMYIVCALLRNAMTCLYGNETSEHFDLEPPSLQNYFV